MKIKPNQAGDWIEEAVGGLDHNMRRARPYDGQPWTDAGQRGKTLIEGITMRDMRDCFVRSVAACSGPGPLYQESTKGEAACINESDIYKVKGLDIMAVCQNMLCEVERLMGIYPNRPEMTYDEVMTHVPVADISDD